MKLPKKLLNQLESRKQKKAFRSLKVPSNLIDFSSNDYLGFAQSSDIFDKTHQFLVQNNIKQNGATGSRLLSGNHNLYPKVEQFLSEVHQSESATIFNSGYDANIGFFSSVPQRGDVILYDELIHASIRDGIKLSNAKAFKFLHNDLDSLEELLKRVRPFNSEQSDNEIQKRVQYDNVVYVVTESVFSMDGDTPDLVAMSTIVQKYNAYFVVDEAHAVGVFDAGLIKKLNLQDEVFARIITFGKAMGCHGATILGSVALQNYLVNFSRSFIYTTGLPPHSLASIKCAYDEMMRFLGGVYLERSRKAQSDTLQQNIHHFLKEVMRLQLDFIASCSAIHCCVVSGNEKVKNISSQLHQKGFDVKAILSPTVPKGKERLRFCLHSYNSTKEITEVLELLKSLIS
jgi:8-amino-7-oxononanoate synthase